GVVVLRGGHDFVDVAEEFLGVLDDLLDLFLQEGAEARVRGGDLIALGLFDDAAGDARPVLEDGDVGQHGGGDQAEDRKDSHDGCPSLCESTCEYTMGEPRGAYFINISASPRAFPDPGLDVKSGPPFVEK